MLQTIGQLIAFAGISIVFGFIFRACNLNFFLGVITGSAVQFVINYMYQTALNTYISLNNKKLENERIKEFTKQGLEVKCPCSKGVIDFVPITLNTNNRYKCKECQKIISVYITPSTALTTEPLTDTDTTNPGILKNNGTS
jgi:hypothetical protein